jgi:hypothetical protein
VSHRPEILASRPSPLFLSLRLLRKASSDWHRRFKSGRGQPAPANSDTTSIRLSPHHSLRLTRRVLSLWVIFDQFEHIFCNEQLTNSSGSFLYDAEIVAGSPLKFEKHPQEFFFREQTPCKSDDHSSQCKRLLAGLGSTVWEPSEIVILKRDEAPFVPRRTSASQPKSR